MVDADNVVRFKFVRHSAIPDASDHSGHRRALLYEIFLADRVIETLTDGNFAEMNTVTGRKRGHYAIYKVSAC